MAESSHRLAIAAFSQPQPPTVALVVGVATEDARTGELWFAVLIPLVQ